MKFLLFLLFSFSTLTFASNIKYVEVEGFELEYEVAGTGKHVILLEAGARASMSDWDPIFNQIATDSKVIRYSRVGNGKSTDVKRHFTSLDYANYANELLVKLEINEPVILIAHSYGGSIVRDFSAAYPEKVKALFMLDPSSEHDVDILRSINLEQGNIEIEQIKLDDMANGMSNSYLDFWSKRPLPNYPEIINIPVTVIASVRKVDDPANLFFSDTGRQMWGELWKKWANKFPQGRTVLTDKSGHFVQFDQPGLVIAELKLLIEKLEKP